MALFPKVQSPCPYKADLAAIMDGDHCRACKRQVHDITGWSDQQRLTFLKACRTEVCVSYRLPATAAAAAAALAAVAAPLPAAAECPPMEVDYVVIVGGLVDLDGVALVEASSAEDLATPELPVVYEDGGSGRPDNTGG